MKKFLLKDLLAIIFIIYSTSSLAYDFEVDNLQYTITSFDDMTVEVSGLVNTSVSEVIIRETVEYRNNILIVTSIGDDAFSSNTKLQYIYIPSTISSIGSRAFSGCTKLSSITLPNSLTSLGTRAFADSGLIEITIPDNISSLSSTFSGCSSLFKVNLPDGIKTIEGSTFYNCTSLSEISLPEGLTSIGTSAFYGCSSLLELSIPDSVASFGTEALVGCTNLEKLSIGIGLEILTEKEESISHGDYHDRVYYSLLQTQGPTHMKRIILKDDAQSFKMRGYGFSPKYTAFSSYIGYPIFSKINLDYFYIGRPLIEISSWVGKESYNFKITESQPYGIIQTLEIGGYCTEVPLFYQSIEYLILDEDVETYTTSNIYQGGLKSITCKSTTPPIVSGTFDNSTYLNVLLYVPIGCKEIYQNSISWKNFWNIEEMDVSSIDDIVNSGEALEVGRYTISGQKIAAPQKGANIVKYSDGSTKKLLVK